MQDIFHIFYNLLYVYFKNIIMTVFLFNNSLINSIIIEREYFIVYLIVSYNIEIYRIKSKFFKKFY